MELHVAEIIIILLGVGKQHVRFIVFNIYYAVILCNYCVHSEKSKTPKSLKGTFESSLNFNEFHFRDQG